MALLKLRKLDKNGAAIYGLEGVRGSIYVSKAMFAADPPAEMEVAYEGFAPPGEGGRAPLNPKTATPEQIEKIRVALEKAEERAAKAKERADKARARAAKYTEKQDKPEEVTA